MKSFLYDEKVLAINIYNNGFTNGYDRKEALLLAKYFRHVLGYGDTKIKNKIIEACSKDPYFNAVSESSSIKSFVKNSKKDFFAKTNIFITKEEIEKSKTIKNFDAQKVYLTLLLLARRSGYNNVPLLFTEIKKIANINTTNNELFHLFHLIYKSGLIYPIETDNHDKTIGYQKILNMYLEGLTAIEIKNDRELYEFGKTYEKYCGGYLVYCEVCQKEEIRKSPAHKLCEEHASEKEKFRKRNARI
jgi:hypothetical protein